MSFRRVSTDGIVETVDTPLSPEQVALLKRRCDDYAAFTEDSPRIAEDFIRSVIAVDPAPYLADFDRFIDSIDEMVGREVLDDGGRAFLRVPLMYFVAEYVIRNLRGTWQIDDVPFSRTFGHYVIDIPLGGTGRMRVSPYEIATDFIESPPPRSLRKAVAHLVKTIGKT